MKIADIKKIPQKFTKASFKTFLKEKVLPIALFSAWALISTIGSQFIISRIITSILPKDLIDSQIVTIIYSVISYLLSAVLIIIVPSFFVKKWSLSREKMGLSGLPTWTDIGLSPVGFIVSLLLAALFTAIFSLFPWFDANQSQNLSIGIFSPVGERMLAFFNLVVVAPIAEEIIFRGFIYGKIRTRFSIPVSIFFTSLIFAIVHLQWNVSVNVFALSIVLCILREITGTTYAGILTHMIKNGIAFYLLFVLGM